MGNVYISGRTQGDLGGTHAGGGLDAFVSKYDANGNLIWTRQIGSSSIDISNSIFADGMGNVFISGYTDGDLDGINAGSWDAFVSKYDANGNFAWTRQLGTSFVDLSPSVSVDSMGNVFISGGTTGDLGGANAGSWDAFVSKFDTNGNLDWTRQMGTLTTDDSSGVFADGMGNVFMSGTTYGDLGGINAGDYDVFLAKIIDLTSPSFTGDYNGDGTVDAADYTVWRDSEGTTGTGLAADGNGDGFVNHIDYDLWKTHFGETSAVSVPEPTSTMIVGLMLVLMGCKRKNR